MVSHCSGEERIRRYMRFASSRFSCSRARKFASFAAILSTTALAANAQAYERLLFTSDVHNEISRLETMLSICTDCELVGVVGDFGVGTTTSSEFAATKAAITRKVPGAKQVLTKGNHDPNSTSSPPGLYTHDTGLVDLGGINQDYDVFAISDDDVNSATRNALNEKCGENTKALIVMSHMPL